MQYTSPETFNEAVSLLTRANGSARLLAGGTDLLVQLRADLIEPDVVIDLKRLPGMRQIEVRNDGFTIGAAVTCAELSEHEDLVAAWPGVVEAAALIGSTQIQGRATLGGNLCNGSPAADSVPALIAAEAHVTILGADGQRNVPIQDVMSGPGRTILGSDEIITSFLLPPRRPRSGSAYLRFIPRTEMDIAVVGTGVQLIMDEAGICVEARVGLGAVAERPILAMEAAEILIGTSVSEDDLETFAQQVGEACRPIDDKRGTREFRIDVAGVLARRTARIALERAKS